MAIKNPPKGYHSVTPALSIDGAAAALDWFRKALGAEEDPKTRMVGPGGKIMHTEMRIGDSAIMVSDTMPEMGNLATSSSFYIYVDDCDALYKKAVAAGGKSTMEPTDCFWGDRMAQVKDAYGNSWSFSTRVKEMSDEEMRKAGEEFMKQQGGPPQ
jgi:PhnB protein